MTKPLDGVRVLDFSEYLPGPVTTAVLADLGADVIKVERPDGDPVRQLMAGFFEATGRGKRSVTLDLKSERGRDAAQRLASQADVILVGWRPGVANRLGLDPESLRDPRPNLVYCSLTGYGESGPRRDEAGHDLNYVGLAGGLVAPEGYIGGAGISLPMADVLGGLYAASAIIAAVRSGKPASIDLALAESVLAAMAPLLSEYVAMGSPTGDTVSRPAYGVFESADGKPTAIGATEDHFFLELCSLLELDELGGDPELATFRGRQRHIARIRSGFAEAVAKWNQADLIEAAESRNLPVTAVNDLESVLGERQFLAREAFVASPEAGDDYVAVGFPALIDGHRPGQGLSQPPALGQHSREVLAEAGLTEEEVDAVLGE